MSSLRSPSCSRVLAVAPSHTTAAASGLISRPPLLPTLPTPTCPSLFYTWKPALSLSDITPIPSSHQPSNKFPCCFIFQCKAQSSPRLRKPYVISLSCLLFPALLPFITAVNHTDPTWQNPNCSCLSICFSLCLECSLHLYAYYSLIHLHLSLVMSFKRSSLMTLSNTLSSPPLILNPLSLLLPF